MSSRFNNIDLGGLPPPEIVETLDFESIYARRLAEFQARYPVEDIESEPIVALLQNASYLETLIRSRINDVPRAVFLATSYGTNLDNLAAFYGVERFVVVEADPEATPPVAEVLESDEAFRRRVQLAIEAQSTAGPRGAYLYWALAADVRVYDAAVTSTTPGQVDVAILTADGEAVGELPGIVQAALSDEDVRPLTDSVEVTNAAVTDYTIEAALTFLPGPDRALILATAEAAAEAYAAAQFRIGRDITLSGVYAALHRVGVQNVALSEPAADLVMDWNEVARCTTITLTDDGTDV